MAERLSSAELEHAATTLLQGIPQYSGLFESGYNGPLAGDWQRIGYIHVYTMTAGNPSMRLFGKAYAPDSQDYARRNFQALQVLGQQDLGTRVLSPLHLHESDLGAVVLYPLGIDKGADRLENHHAILDRALFRQVAKDFNLTLLRPQHDVSTIEIGGITYTTDIFDDTDPFEGYSG